MEVGGWEWRGEACGVSPGDRAAEEGRFLPLQGRAVTHRPYGRQHPLTTAGDGEHTNRNADEFTAFCSSVHLQFFRS